MNRDNLIFQAGFVAAAMMIGYPALGATPMAPAAAPADPSVHSINVVVGQKMLDDKDWNKNFKAAGLPSLKSQTSFGLETTYGPKAWPVSLATDVLYSSASGKSSALGGKTVTGHTLEFAVGARKVFVLSMPVRPYVGLGAAYGSGAVTCSGCSSRAPSGVGFWASGGAFYQLSRLNAGLGVRYSAINGEDGGFKLKVGGINANLIVGLGF